MTKQLADRIWLAAMRTGALWGCHQRADRSFFIRRRQFPMCARCTGVVLGHLAAAVYCFRRSSIPRAMPFALCLLMFADWLRQELGSESTNRRRLVTGFAGGFGTECFMFLTACRLFRLFRAKPDKDRLTAL